MKNMRGAERIEDEGEEGEEGNKKSKIIPISCRLFTIFFVSLDLYVQQP